MFHLRKIRRLSHPVVALSLILAALAPALVPAEVSAGQVQTRSIEMSTSKPFVSGDPAVTYHVSFKFATVAPTNVGGIVLDFCDNDPIINETTCTAPAGFASGTTVANQSNNAGADISTFTTVTAVSHGIALTTGTPVSMSSSAAVVSFDLTNVTNPSTPNHSFYARLYTYGTQAAANGYTVANPSVVAPYIDAGGFAMSTGTQVTVTAKVQEQLAFCVYTGASCGTGSSVTLGDSNGVLAFYNTNYTDASTKFDISTNAQTGAIVRLKMDILRSGGNSIAQQGTSCTADSTNTAVAQFGLRISNVGAAPLEGIAPYNCAAGNHTLDSNNTTGTTSVYGQPIADTCNATCSALATTVGTVEFAAKAGLTTPAGIYTTLADFIATGYF